MKSRVRGDQLPDGNLSVVTVTVQKVSGLLPDLWWSPEDDLALCGTTRLTTLGPSYGGSKFASEAGAGDQQVIGSGVSERHC